jgi:hypothetical protein
MPDVGQPILAAAGYQPASAHTHSRLKGGCSQDWLPHGGVHAA